MGAVYVRYRCSVLLPGCIPVPKPRSPKSLNPMKACTYKPRDLVWPCRVVKTSSLNPQPSLITRISSASSFLPLDELRNSDGACYRVQPAFEGMSVRIPRVLSLFGFRALGFKFRATRLRVFLAFRFRVWLALAQKVPKYLHTIS